MAIKSHREPSSLFWSNAGPRAALSSSCAPRVGEEQDPRRPTSMTETPSLIGLRGFLARLELCAHCSITHQYADIISSIARAIIYIMVISSICSPEGSPYRVDIFAKLPQLLTRYISFIILCLGLQRYFVDTYSGSRCVRLCSLAQNVRVLIVNSTAGTISVLAMLMAGVLVYIS